MDYIQQVFSGVQGRLIATALLIAVLYLFRIFLHKIINSRIKNLRRRYFWRQMVNYLVLVTMLNFVVKLWLVWITSMLTFLSLVGAALVIISKELILNYVGYGVIIMRGLFDVGDRIQIGQQTGDVMEIGPLYLTLAEVGNWVQGDEPTGRTIKVPNSQVLTQSIANYSRGLPVIWNEISLDLTANSNLEKARSILQQVAEQHSFRFTAGDLEDIRKSNEDIIFTNKEPSVYVRWRDGRILMTMRYACKFHKRRSTEQQIWDDLITRLSREPDVELAGK